MLISPEIFNLLSLSAGDQQWLDHVSTSPVFYAHLAEVHGSLIPREWNLGVRSLEDEFKEFSRETKKLSGHALLGYLAFMDDIDESKVQTYCCGQFYFSLMDNHENLVNTRNTLEDSCEYMFNMFIAGIQLGTHGKPLARQFASELNNNVKDRLAQIYASAVALI